MSKRREELVLATVGLAHLVLPVARAQLDGFREKLIASRSLPLTLKQALELIPGDAHPMGLHGSRATQVLSSK